MNKLFYLIFFLLILSVSEAFASGSGSDSGSSSKVKHGKRKPSITYEQKMQELKKYYESFDNYKLEEEEDVSTTHTRRKRAIRETTRNPRPTIGTPMRSHKPISRKNIPVIQYINLKNMIIDERYNEISEYLRKYPRLEVTPIGYFLKKGIEAKLLENEEFYKRLVIQGVEIEKVLAAANFIYHEGR